PLNSFSARRAAKSHRLSRRAEPTGRLVPVRLVLGAPSKPEQTSADGVSAVGKDAAISNDWQLTLPVPDRTAPNQFELVVYLPVASANPDRERFTIREIDLK